MKRLVPIIITAFALGCGGSSPDAPSGTDAGDPSSGQDSVASSDADDPGLSDSGAPSETDSTGASDVEPVLADAGALPEPDSDVEPVLADAGDPSEPDSLDDTSPDEPDVDDQLAVDAGPQPLPPGLHGQAPPDALPLPQFVATNYDGSVRGPEDLTGHPTVLWFFPFAGTPT